MKKSLVVLFFFTAYCNSLSQSKPGSKQESLKLEMQLSYEIISSANASWGYDIYINGILKIHQPNIPSRPGNTGFKSKEAATKIAELIIAKIKRGEMPPTVTEEELKKLNVI